jgi:cyclic pyranopterin phosphate synthase
MAHLKDNFGRSFPYFRISITDVCNFKCGYCLPNGYQKSENKKEFLSLEEIKRIGKALSELGVCKIRLTGGEPTVRNDFVEIIENLKSLPGINKVVFTTNGYNLKNIAKSVVNAKIDGINVSIDSLDREKFKFITGKDKLEDILIGLKALQELNFKNIKVNAVLLKGVNDSEQDFDGWQQFIESNNVDFRYIELMQTGDNLDYFKKYHVSANVFRDYLLKKEWIHQTAGFDSGPSKNYIHKDFRGKFGIIAPYSKDFCKSCNRLRITAQGDLRLCLFGDTGISLRALLQNDEQIPQLKDLINAQLNFKKESHYLELGNTGITPHLASIGG